MGERPSRQELMRLAEAEVEEHRATFCASCGASAVEGSRYCQSCGAYWEDVAAGLWEDRDD